MTKPDLRGCQHPFAEQHPTGPAKACCASNPLPPEPQPRRCGERANLKEYRQP